MAQRHGMNVTSHNISNVNTKGYSRQRVELSPTPPYFTAKGLIGSGVMLDNVSRLRNQFIDSQLRTANHQLGEADSQSFLLNQIEAMFNEPSEVGLNNAMTKFFNSFKELSANPEETGIRNIIVQNANHMTRLFQKLDSNVKQLRTDIVENTTGKLNRINKLTKEISEIDIQIIGYSGQGVEAGDLKDERDRKLDELSKLINIRVTEDLNGSVMVSAGGHVISSRGGFEELKLDLTGNTMKIVAGNTGKQVKIDSGEVGGELKNYNSVIPGYIDKLNQLVSTLIMRVNELHATGFGLGNPPETGLEFFIGTDASTIAINPAIANNLNNIAASSDGTAGNNGIALLISNVMNEPIMNNNTTSLSHFYNTIIGSIGTDITNIDSAFRTTELIATQLEIQRNSISGVSLDEEMANMIKFQQSFDAAAKVINTVNEMYQTILNMV